MVESFRGLGVEAVPGVGAPFDPELHEAIMREENDEVPDGTVLREFRRGFRLAGKLLRAAMVQARGPRPAPALRPRRGRLVGGLQVPGAVAASTALGCRRVLGLAASAHAVRVTALPERD